MSSNATGQTKKTQKNAKPQADSAKSARKVKPLKIDRYFSDPNVHPFDQIEWTHRTATITDEHGKVVFEQKDVEVPKAFSQLATKVVVSKYFYGEQGTDERENSFRQLVHRVARTIADWGYDDGIFDSKEQADLYYEELAWICVNQYAAFNSPVWFNVGLYHQHGVEGSQHNYHWNKAEQKVEGCPNTYEFPQGSACFIQSVDDTMDGIMDLAVSEAMLFKHGSGTGTDLSTIRSSREKLSGGGRPSGPLSFMRVYDQIAAVVKSGGKTRRAAKMQSLKVHHPDINDFIQAKSNEEKKAWALIEEGYDGNFNGEAYGSIMFQNANLSVRVTDEFMGAAENSSTFQTRSVTTGEPVETLDADETLRLISEGTSICGDPGVQYDTTINTWHTCPNTGPINASNPCSEYMFLDNSACNLASMNLMKFRNDDGSFDIESYRRVTRILIIAQELLVDNGSYPTDEIAQNSHDYRPLGLGYANLGSLLMSLGLPYDSDEGRAIAASLTAIMCGTAYAVSAELAESQGTFPGYAKNREPMLNVIKMHRNSVADMDKKLCPEELYKASQESWDEALAQGSQHGYRNSQVTVIAPTGTIGFMMDCDTTGIEPDIALVKYKQLAGGGMLKIVNQTVGMALDTLGYNEEQIKTIVDTIEEDDTIETSDVLKNEHLAVFDCAFKAANGQRSIHHMAHIKMMAATQPFISGAISKTVNMPEESTVEEIQDAYMQGWKLGLKALAIYRDGSKRSQPLSTKTETEKFAKEEVKEPITENLERRPQRVRLPQTRQSITHKFDVAGHEGYLTVGLYEDGQPGELFITMAKEGSTVGGLMDAFGISVSLALQSGVAVPTVVEKFSHTRFEPAGMTTNRDIPFAKSIIDYIAKWLGITFMPGYLEANSPRREESTPQPASSETPKKEEATDGATNSRLKKRVNLNHITNRIDELIDVVNKNPVESTTDDGQGGKQQAASFNQLSNKQFSQFQSDAPICDVCGTITVRNANCYRCFNCGNSMGCS